MKKTFFILLYSLAKEVLGAVDLARPFSVAIFEDTVFFSDMDSDTILCVNMYTGEKTDVLRAGSTHVLGLKVVHPVLQRPGEF